MFAALAFLVILHGAIAVRDYTCEPNGYFPLMLTAGGKEVIYTHPRGGMYSGAKNCSWYASCPDTFDVQFECPFVNIPETPDCEDEYMIFITHNAVHSRRYCGSDRFHVTSVGPELGVALVAPANTTGGYFVCQVSCRSVFLRDILS